MNRSNGTYFYCGFVASKANRLLMVLRRRPRRRARRPRNDSSLRDVVYHLIVVSGALLVMAGGALHRSAGGDQHRSAGGDRRRSAGVRAATFTFYQRVSTRPAVTLRVPAEYQRCSIPDGKPIFELSR